MGTWDLGSWSQQQLTFLLVATFVGIIVVLIAFLVYLRRTRVSPPPPRPEVSEDDAELAAPPNIVLRREGWTNRLEVEIDGKAFRRMRDVEDPAARRAVMLAAADLVSFAGIARSEAPSQDGLPGEPVPAHVESTPARYYAPARELAVQAFLAQLEQADLGAEPAKNWLEIVGKSLARRSLAEYEDRNFVEEIGDLLQRRLAEQNLDIEVRLQTDGQGIVRVEVDGILYDSPGDIPDLAVREALRAAVGEWEARF